MSSPAVRAEVSQLLAMLRKHVRPQQRPEYDPGERVSTGLEALDDLLPGRGIRPGSLVEWLSPEFGCGAGTLAFLGARQACGRGGALVVIDREGEFYPPAAAGLGIDLGRTILVRPRLRDDAWWALDQALRWRGVAAVVAWPERLDERTFRRLQLAAETGGSLGLLLRGPRARAAPSWAEVRWWVEPLGGCPADRISPGGGRRLRIELLRAAGSWGRGETQIELAAADLPPDGVFKTAPREGAALDETSVVSLASRLAPAAAARRAAGA